MSFRDWLEGKNKVLGIIRDGLSQQAKNRKLSENTINLLSSFVSQLDSALKADDNKPLIISILKQIEAIELDVASPRQTTFFGEGDSTNSKIFAETLPQEKRVVFASTIQHQIIKIPADEIKIFSALHEALLEDLKKKNNATWIFDYTPNPILLKKWQNEVDPKKAKATKDALVDYERDVKFFYLKGGKKTEMKLQKKDEKVKNLAVTLDELVPTVVALTKYNDEDQAKLIVWLERNGGQILNSFINVDLIGCGLVYDSKQDTNSISLMGSDAKQEWCINKEGQLVATLRIKSSLLNLPVERQCLAFDLEKKCFRLVEIFDDDFDDIYKQGRAGNTPPVLDIEATIILEIEKGEVVTRYKSLYIISHTDLLLTPARFENRNHPNHKLFYPTKLSSDEPAEKAEKHPSPSSRRESDE